MRPLGERRVPNERSGTLVAVRALVLDASDLAAQRAAAGIDMRDEMWKGVLHMVPAAIDRHQRLEADLLRWLWPYADAAGLVVTTDTGLYLADDDWRVPDLVVASDAHRTARGVELGAEVVIDIRSPGDETLDKIEFHGHAGVSQVVVIDRDTCELHSWRLEPDVRRLVAEDLPGSGSVSVQSLRVLIRRVEGPNGPWIEIQDI